MLWVSRVIAAPREAVWDVLIDVTAWPRWGPSISRAELDDGARRLTGGSTGRVYPRLGPPLPFTVDEFETGRCWGWTVAGVKATSHRVETVDGETRVTFGAPWWAAAYLPVCMVALRRIEAISSC